MKLSGLEKDKSEKAALCAATVSTGNEIQLRLMYGIVYTLIVQLPSHVLPDFFSTSHENQIIYI
jgi:hypothetical protein